MTDTMQPCKSYESLLTEALFGDLEEQDQARLDLHLSECGECAQTLEELQATLSMASERRRPEPDQAFWDGYYDQLVERMTPAQRPQMFPQVRLHEIRERLGSLIAPPPRWALQMVAAMALVAIGLVLGRTGIDTGLETVADAQQDLAQNEDAGMIQPAALETRTHAYLGKSKTLLLGLVNFDAATENAETLNLPRRQEIAQELVQEASFLKNELNSYQQQRLRELVSDLEVILLQIANIEAAYDVPEIEMVQSGVDRKALLFKIDVENMRKEDATDPDERAESLVPRT